MSRSSGQKYRGSTCHSCQVAGRSFVPLTGSPQGREKSEELVSSSTAEAAVNALPLSSLSYNRRNMDRPRIVVADDHDENAGEDC